MSRFIIQLSVFFILTISIFSQELINDSNGKIKNNGTIKFNSSSAKLTNNNSNPITDNKVLNPGTIEFSGTVSNAVFDGSSIIGINGQRMPGIVKYSATSGDIILVGTGSNTYYTHLILSGNSNKTINDGIFVAGSYTESGGDRTYLGTFYYDGSSEQQLAGENASSGNVNIYNNLSLHGGGQKLIASGSSNHIFVNNTLQSVSGTNLLAKGTLLIGQSVSAGNSTLNGGVTIDGNNGSSSTDASVLVKNSETDFNGNINIRNGGSDDAMFILDGSAAAYINANLTVETSGGLVAVNIGAGELIIAESGNLTLENNSYSALNLADGAEMSIFGTYINNYTTDFSNADYNNSTVFYRHATNAMDITRTSQTNPYGNIQFLGSGIKTANGNFYVNGDLSVNGCNVDMYDSGNDYTLTMLNSQAAINYNANEEIVGKLKRIVDSDNDTYTFNNTNTTVLFTSLTSTYPDDMTFSVRPGVNPLRYIAETDINRRIVISYAEPSNPFTMTLKAQYKNEELFSGTYDQETLKFMEATSASVPEKLSTGEERTITESTGDGTVGHILLPGIKSGSGNLPNGLDLFASGNDLLIRGGPSAMYAISNGRWSNSLTWDEGREPAWDDVVIIDGYTVHVGFVRATDNYNGDESTPSQLAQEIRIGASENSSLLFGSSDISGTQPLFKLSPNATITNRALYSSGFPDNDTEDVGSTLYMGLIIYDGSSLLVNDLLNDGTLSNGGHLEIGDQ